MTPTPDVVKIEPKLNKENSAQERAHKFIKVLRSDIEEECDGEELFNAQC